VAEKLPDSYRGREILKIAAVAAGRAGFRVARWFCRGRLSSFFFVVLGKFP
jgi:hypothetical protein